MYMRHANDRLRYNVTSSLIGWAHTQWSLQVAQHKGLPHSDGYGKPFWDIAFLVSGKNKADLGDQFWDLVVITASDEDQRVAFETQIQNKLAKHQIPHGLPYLVYADPPGPKIGNA